MIENYDWIGLINLFKCLEIRVQLNFVGLEQYLKSQRMLAGQSDTGEYQSNLTYYKQKVQGLEAERQAWLAKFDECSAKLNQKQQKQQKLMNLKDEYEEMERDIVHHQIACFDERLNALNLDRNNQNLEFEEAEQLVKIRELAEEFPAAVGFIEKQLPCIGHFSGDIIQNDLNLHSNPTGKKGNQKFSEGSKKKQPEDKKIQQSNSASIPKKKTLEQLLKFQVIQTKKINQQELQIMECQQEVLEQSIKDYKQKQKTKVEKQRNVVKEFNKKYKQLESRHKKLAEAYFEYRRKHKSKVQNTRNENKHLKNTLEKLEQKVEAEMRIYEKQNKAKQALILRRSQDFQEDYKARMRAKERDLQALKQNYEKMQEICIRQMSKLQRAVDKVTRKLQRAQQQRNFLTTGLREQLKELQKRCNEQRIQKARMDIKLKKRMQEEQQRIKKEEERQEKQRKAEQKQQLLKNAYKKTGIPKKTFSYTKTSSKENKKAAVNNAESSGDEDSLQISDIENLRKQIKDLQKNIAASDER